MLVHKCDMCGKDFKAYAQRTVLFRGNGLALVTSSCGELCKRCDRVVRKDIKIFISNIVEKCCSKD